MYREREPAQIDVKTHICTIPYYDTISFMQSRQNVYVYNYMAVCQNLVPLVNIKIAGKWMFIPVKMVLIGIDPYPYIYVCVCKAVELSTINPDWSCKATLLTIGAPPGIINGF